MVKASSVLDRVLVLEMVRVTEAAAVAASKLIGRGDEKAADHAAVEAMRAALNTLDIDGTVVIGEGERDEAPMLYHRREGRRRAKARRPQDRHRARSARRHDDHRQGRRQRLAVLAIAEQGNLLNAPDVYMDKLAVGPGYPDGVIDLAKSPTENVRAVAAAKGVEPDEIIVCVLDGPRHAELIAELRGLGCGIQLIPDGDVAGVIAVTDPDTTIDLYMGSGGAPEGVLAAAALRCVGGQFQGRLLFRNDDERARAAKWGVEDLEPHLPAGRAGQGRLASSPPPASPRARCWRASSAARTAITTESVVMRASTGTVRWVKGEHRHDHAPGGCGSMRPRPPPGGQFPRAAARTARRWRAFAGERPGRCSSRSSSPGPVGGEARGATARPRPDRRTCRRAGRLRHRPSCSAIPGYRPRRRARPRR